jgi:dTMP kinase
MGKLIVIEGLDGSGKQTQAQMLKTQIGARFDKVQTLSYPDYESQSSALVRMYLAGDIAPRDEVNAHAASTFYTCDRYISYMKNWKHLYEDDYILIMDRYTQSNIIHQLSKLPRDQWWSFMRWVEELEYEYFKIPSPDIIIYLDMDPDVSAKLIDKRGEKKDIHESDLEYLHRCREAAQFAIDHSSSQYERKDGGWKVVKCDDGTNPRERAMIHWDIFGLCQPLLNASIIVPQSGGEGFKFDPEVTKYSV